MNQSTNQSVNWSVLSLAVRWIYIVGSHEPPPQPSPRHSWVKTSWSLVFLGTVISILLMNLRTVYSKWICEVDLMINHELDYYGLEYFTLEAKYARLDVLEIHVNILIVQAWTTWLIVHMHLVTWPCEIACIIVCPVRLPIIMVQVSYKARLVSIFKLYL